METSNNTRKPIPILLIDDDGNIINGISQIIEDAFPDTFQITKAYDGHQAVLYLEKQYYPIIISDIMMPNMDGLQLLELIKSHGIPSKVIMLSGYDDYAYVRKSMKTGAYDYLLKPFISIL
ncbi:MAG: response regulator [Oscillospiraceae bacterium]|nr:response regulator [Oscillospiraceae bacterium]